MAGTRELARVTLPTAFGEFDAHAFESAAGVVHLALVKGRIARTNNIGPGRHSFACQRAILKPRIQRRMFSIVELRDIVLRI